MRFGMGVQNNRGSRGPGRESPSGVQGRSPSSVIFVLIYFLVLVLVLVFEIFFSFSFVLVFIIFSF